MHRMDYKQQSNQGCLVVDLLYLFQVEPTRELERDILSDGLFRLRDNYTFGCLLAFLDRYADKAVTIYVDNNYYMGVLNKLIRRIGQRWWARLMDLFLSHQNTIIPILL